MHCRGESTAEVKALPHAIMEAERFSLQSWIEIEADKLAANYLAVQAAAGQAYEIVAVIKADAYGHGATLCAPALARAGARWFGVSDLEEGLAVRRALKEAELRAHLETDLAPHARVLVMCGFGPEDAPALVEHDLTPVIWTPEHLHHLQSACEALNTRTRVHLEIDSGMARQGAQPGNSLRDFGRALERCSRVQLEGVFSHLSSGEKAGGERTREQENILLANLDLGETVLSFPERIHLANTSGVDEGSTLAKVAHWTQLNAAVPMVRTGLALYGYALPLEAATGGTLAAARLQPRLQPIATWKTRVIGLREIAPGNTVGYGASFTAQHPMRLALLPVGYADGFRREASSGMGNGWVMIAGQRAPVVGRVSMNLTVVDATKIASCAVGDEVVLLGDGVTAKDHAHWCGTIPYEILCGMRAHRLLR